MGERVANIQQARHNRWNRQRADAIRREQEARCYRQHTPAQLTVACNEPVKHHGVHRTPAINVVEACDAILRERRVN